MTTRVSPGAEGLRSVRIELEGEFLLHWNGLSLNRKEMKVVLTWLFVAGAMVLACESGVAGPERWADSRLPVKGGLEVWLDASRQNAARVAKQLPGLNEGRAVDIWFDGSGNQIDIVERMPEARPRFKMASGGAFVRFDGKDDSLAAVGLHRTFTNSTIFVVAAPRSNIGNFRALLAFNATGRNDYQSGVNLDLGVSPSASFSILNAEGAGFQGVRNLLTNYAAFRTFHTVALTCEPGTSGVRLFVDGAAHRARERDFPVLRMDELTVGARCFSNTPEPPHTQGFFDGDIAEVLIFSRALPQNERTAVERYLNEKYTNLRSASDTLTPGGLRPLEMVANPPPVQMFVPGFTVRELPIGVKNINNLKYRADGKLVALGYDGRIYLLSDSDGDGLEDKAEPFWERDTLRAPIGMALTPPGYARGEGLFVAAKGKLALIVDHDHDGRADEEIVVASGWKELGHGVDALGVALDRQGNIYFGLGCANFTDPYSIDKTTGKSHYDVRNERGTILKVSPDFSHREIVCTGIRFPVALSFNRSGDLFCTDQEGATWLPNGNPFDELLHIEPGRHYGFPPRHPKHLPNVINEPSVFDYAPQHQSTCGLNFNESANGGAVFGPSWWAGDAIVSGYSRGKLFRTKLVKTVAGYVAQNQLMAALNMLAVDACVSPQEDLVVATHSGNPDWGSGPDGQGKLYKISYTGRELAQPVIAWAATPTEMRIAFDRPLDPTQLKELAKRTTITQGRYASAGDRFESLRPGYQAVEDQLAAERYDVPVLSAILTGDHRSIILNTPPQTAALNYAISFPRFGAAENRAQAKGALPQEPSIDLQVDMTGVQAVWQNESNTETWSGWLPHLDFQAARTITVASAEHERFWTLLNKPGKLTLCAKLDVWQMLEPAVQPGSQIDYAPPRENVTVEFRSTGPFKFKTGVEVPAAPLHRISVDAQPGESLPIQIVLKTGKLEPDLKVTWYTTDDPRHRALPLRRILLPWATQQIQNQTNKVDREIPEIAGGNWLHGKRLFFSEQVACSKCHRVRSEGGKIGPDLSNLVFRDYASVLRDIVSPNATINPDHLAYNIQLRSGDWLAGVLQSEKTNEIVLGVVSGESVRVPKNQVASINPSAISLMPEGLTQALSAQELKDLMMFLLISPVDPARLEGAGEPPPRSRAQVDSILKQASGREQQATNIFRILLSAGPKDHGPGEHDYGLWQKRWDKLLGLGEGVKVSTTFGWPTTNQFQNAEVIVFYSDNPGWSAEGGAELDAFLKGGGGLVYLHYAVDGHEAVKELSERIGLAWRGGGSKFRHGPLDLKFANHPLAAGFETLDLIDESYWDLVGNEKNIQLVASGNEEGAARPLVWTREEGRGRVFVSIPGHYTWSLDDPLLRVLILRGICWAGHEPMDRLSELATIGARISD